MLETIPMLEILNSKVFGVSTERLLQLKFEGGKIEHDVAKERSALDLLDNISTYLYNDGETLDKDINHWPSSQIRVPVSNRVQYRFIDYIKDSITKWYGREIERRKAIIEGLQVYTRENKFDEIEPFRFTDPHMSSARLYLQFLFFCIANITKLEEDNKNHTYSNPYFEDNTKYVITGTFDTQIPVEPISWEIASVSKIKDKMDVILDSLNEDEKAIFIIPKECEKKFLEIKGYDQDKYLRITHKSVSIFKDLIDIFKFRSVGTNRERYDHSERIKNKIIDRYRKDVILNEDLFSNAEGEYRDRNISFEITVDNNEITLLDKILELRDKRSPWIQLIGEGGMGKTTSLLYLFEKFYNDTNNLTPFYLELQQKNHTKKNSIREYWILEQIVKEYHLDQELGDNSYTNLEAYLKKETDKPEYIFLLDGHNEIQSEHVYEINKELENLIAHYPNLMILMTSRVENTNFNIEPVVINLSGISEIKAIKFLNSNNKVITEDLLKSAIINNPMYLKMLVDTDKMDSIYNFSNLSNKERLSFGFYEDDPLILKSKGEVLKTYFAFMKLKWFRSSKDKEQVNYTVIRYVFNEILPSLALMMEKEGMYVIGKREISDHIKTLLDKWNDEEWVQDNEYLSLYELEDKYFRKSRILNYIVNDIMIGMLGVLYIKDEKFSFNHQDLRDYFAASYYEMNIIKFNDTIDPDDPVEKKIKNISLYLKELKKNILSSNLKNIIGQVSRETWKIPKIINGNFQENKKKTLFDNLLNRLRYVQDSNDVEYLNYNIIQSMISCGTDLSNYNFSYLSLNSINLNGIKLGRPFQNGANFTGVKLNKSNLFSLGHSNEVTSMAYNSDGNKLISGSRDNTVKVWDTKTYSLLETLKGHKGMITSVSFSSDNKKILTSSWDQTIKIWNADTFKLIVSLSGHKGGICSAAFNPKGDKIVSGCVDGTVSIWDVSKSAILLNIHCHKGCVNSVSFDLEGKKFISGSSDGTIKIWSMDKFEHLKTLNMDVDLVEKVFFSSDNKKIITGAMGKTIKIWDARTYKPIKIFKRNIKGLSDTFPKYDKDCFHGKTCSLFFNSDKNQFYTFSYDGILEIFNAKNYKLIKKIDSMTNNSPKYNTTNIVSLTFNSNYTRLSIGLNDGSIEIFDTIKYNSIGKINSNVSYIQSFTFSSDKKVIASKSDNNIIYLWDSENYKLISTLDRFSSNIYSFYFTDDGLFVTTCIDGMRLWDMRTYEQIENLNLYNKKLAPVKLNCLNSVQAEFSNDKRLMVTGDIDGTINIWNTTQKFISLRKTINAHSKPIHFIKFIMDDKLIISGSTNYKIKVWDTSSYKEIKRTIGTISNDNKKIIECSEKGSINFYDLNSFSLIKEITGFAGIYMFNSKVEKELLDLEVEDFISLQDCGVSLF